MIILGVALLAACTLLGTLLGDLLGLAIGVKANVGGVGIAMILLIAARAWLLRRGLLGDEARLGVLFWAGIYIPIVVAMAAQQNVVAAVSGGPLVLVAAVGSVTASFAMVAVLNRLGGSGSESHADAPRVEAGGRVIAGEETPTAAARRT